MITPKYKQFLLFSDKWLMFRVLSFRILFVTFIAVISCVVNADEASYCSTNQILPNKKGDLTDWLKKLESDCNTEFEKNRCRDLLREGVEYQDLKTCDANEIVAKEFIPESKQFYLNLKACFVDKAQRFVMDIYADAKEYIDNHFDHLENKKDFINTCNKQLECKKSLAKTIGKYQNFSDQEFQKLNAEFLVSQIEQVALNQKIIEREKKQYLNILEREADYKKRYSQKPTKNSDEKNFAEQIIALKDLVAEKIKSIPAEERKKISCMTQEAQRELWCARVFMLMGGEEVVLFKATQKGGLLLRAVQTSKVEQKTSSAIDSFNSPEKYRLKTGEVSTTGSKIEPNETASTARSSFNNRRTQTIEPKSKRTITAAEIVASRSAARTALVEEKLRYDPTTDEQRRKWIVLANKSINKNDSLKATFLEVENSVMKLLNDTTLDHDFVTALTNKHKEILFKKMKELESKNPGLTIDPYSDWKASRFAITGNRPKDLDQQLKKLFEEANDEFSDFMKKNKIVRNDDKVQNWFRGGVGSTADEASISARVSRNIEGKNELRFYSDESIQEKVKSAYDDAGILRSSLVSDFGSSGLMESYDELGRKVFKKEVYEVFRKESNPEAIRAQLNLIYPGAQVSEKQLNQMQQYMKAVDTFSPSIWVEKRDLASFSGSAFGGASADFAGMGAHNLRGTAIALTKANDVGSSIMQARKEEKVVTAMFEKRKKDYENTVQNFLVEKKKIQDVTVTCSGDDCILITANALDEKLKKELVHRFSKSETPSQMRLSFVDDAIKDGGLRNEVASHGEKIEKLLRSKLAGEIPKETLDRVIFGVDMKAVEVGSGHVKLIIGNSRVRLAPDDISKIQNSFQEAVKTMNEINAKTLGSQVKGYIPLK